MKSLCTRFVLAVAVAFTPAVAARQQVARKAAPAKTAAAKTPGKSALDKATLEPYVRHLFVWGPAIQVKISDPVPAAQLPGFFEVRVTGSTGNASQEETFLVSKDGQKILRAMVFDVRQNPFKADLDKLKTQFQPSFGTPGAPVVLVQFSDFQCPYCKEEAKLLRDNLLKTYPKEVRLYYKDFPLEQIHPWAKPAAIAGRCVFQQNPLAFWDYYDWMFARQQEITSENLRAKVMEFGQQKSLDVLQLGRCLDTRATEAEVARNTAEAKSLNVTSLPTLFVNGRRLVGQVNWPGLKQIIDYELNYQKTAQNAGEAGCCEVAPLSPAARVGP